MGANHSMRSLRRTGFGKSLLLGVVFPVALFLSGCSRWSHPAKGEREFQNDRAVCEHEADEKGETEYWPRYEIQKACMIERGWSVSDSWCCDREPSSH